MANCRASENIVYISGLITEDTVEEVINSNDIINRIELNSAGGVLSAAYKLAEWIRQNNITTSVRKNAICFSACTLLFQAGVKRIAAPNASFMYHSARFSDVYIQNFLNSHESTQREEFRLNLAKFFDDAQKENLIFFNLLLKYGINPDLIRLYQMQPEEINWLKKGNLLRKKDLFLKPTQLLKYNVVTEIMNQNKPYLPNDDQWIKF